jgi:chondroitin synthase
LVLGINWVNQKKSHHRDHREKKSYNLKHYSLCELGVLCGEKLFFPPDCNDNTLSLLQRKYRNNPRVRIMTKKNGGIASASNSAVKMARGYYIAQLDYVETDAVELCLNEFFKDHKLACVYTTNRNIDADGKLLANGYNWHEFSREKLTTAMILHHFRMFTARAWNLTSGFDEKTENAVDYDMYLKLSEVGSFKHVNRICYNRTLHGEKTSIKELGLQKKIILRLLINP